MTKNLYQQLLEKAIALEKIPVYGSGINVRDWLYVLDHCQAIDLVFQKGKAGENI